MNEVEKLALLASLESEFCELNHGPETGHPKIPAADYIVQPFGYNTNDIEQVTIRDIVVPVCLACADTLQGTDWTLFYCFECCSSQWVSRKYAKGRYRHSILWLRGCPQCTSEFGGLYFTDFKALVDKPMFLKSLSGTAAA